MSILDGLMRMDRETHRLEELKKKLKPALDRKLNYCVKCGFCCNMRTCVPTPDELKKIAKYLKLTTKELINKFYAIDRQSFGDIYYVKPVGENIKDLSGKFIPSNRTYNEGKCIFLDKNNNCKIHKVKPKIAVMLKCWLENDDNYNKKTDELEKKKKTIDSWKPNRLKDEFGIDGEKLEEIENEKE